MTIQLVLGMMNPLAMIVVALVIAAEKLLPRPAIVARLVGVSALIAGIASFCAVYKSLSVFTVVYPWFHIRS